MLLYSAILLLAGAALGKELRFSYLKHNETKNYGSTSLPTGGNVDMLASQRSLAGNKYSEPTPQSREIESLIK